MKRKEPEEMEEVLEQEKMHDHEEEERKRRRRPFRKMAFPGREERGWLETAFRMGASCPEFCLSKVVTGSDASRSQHRYQLTTNDVDGSMRLQEIAARARARTEDKDDMVVNVLDKMGRRYRMVFKHIVSNSYFRFMGEDWSRFLDKTGLKEKQTMTIWGLPGVSKGKDKGDWFVFVNSDEEEREEEEKERDACLRALTQ